MDVSPDNGIVKVNQATSYSYPVTFSFINGTSVRLEAQPNPGYRFAGWQGDLSGATNPVTILMDCNKNIVANFAQITHKLILEIIGEGSVTPTAGIYTYPQGTVIKLEATPDDGWQFDGWTGDTVETESATTVLTMDSDKNIVANFSQIMHTLTIKTNGSGSTTPIAGQYSYSRGTEVSITATPADGWQFDGWTGDTEMEPTNISLIIDSDIIVIANFSANKADLSEAKRIWSLIGGITVGIVVIGVAIWFVVKRRIA